MLLKNESVTRGNVTASLVEAGCEVGALGVPREVGVPEGVRTEPSDAATRRRHGQGRQSENNRAQSPIVLVMASVLFPECFKKFHLKYPARVTAVTYEILAFSVAPSPLSLMRSDADGV